MFIWYIRTNQLNGILAQKPFAYAHALPTNCFYQEIWKKNKHTLSVRNRVGGLVLFDDDNDDDDNFGVQPTPSPGPSPPDRSRCGGGLHVGSGIAAPNRIQSAPSTTNNSTTNTHNIPPLQPIPGLEYGAGDGSDDNKSDDDVVQGMAVLGRTPSGATAANGMDVNVNVDTGNTNRRRRYNMRKSTREKRRRYQ